MKNQRIFSTKNMIIGGLMVALNIILSRILGFPLGPVKRVSFGGMPTKFASITIHPLMGMTIGIVSDVIGYLINPGGGAFFPGFTLTAALGGLWPGLIIRNKSQYTFLRVGAVCLATSSTAFFLNSIWIKILYGKAFVALLAARLPATLMMLVVNTVVLYLLLTQIKLPVMRVQKKEAQN